MTVNVVYVYTCSCFFLCRGQELASLTVAPINMHSVINHHSDVIEYQAKVQSGHGQLDVKQSPIVIHREFQKHFPRLQQLYQELLPPCDHP